MSNSLTKKLERRKRLLQKIATFTTELSELDREIFPRIEALVSAIDGNASAVKTQRAKLMRTLKEKTVMEKILQSKPRLLVYEVEKLLREANVPMKTVEIYNELMRRGVEVRGKVPQNNLAAHLSHHSKVFIRTPEGWLLKQRLLTEQTNAHAAH